MTENHHTNEEMAKYGITSKTVHEYFVGEYRYTNLRDAISQAKRIQKKK